jgi:peptidyl-prolyl cis-trans isomerase C
MKKLLCVFVVAAAFGVSILGCSKKDGDKSAKESDQLIVMQIDDQKIDSVVLEKFLESRPIPMNAENIGELLKKSADELVAEELLYREALRLKLDQAPDTRQKIRELLNQKLAEEQIHKKVMQRKIEQPELQSYYETHQEEFNRPEEVRVADVFIAVPKDASPDQRAELKQKAETVLAEAVGATNPRAIFPRLIRTYSDQPERYAKGDTGFFSAEGKPTGIDPGIVGAAFNLEKSGDVATTIIEAADGYHIIMQNGKRAAFNKPFDQVAGLLERRVKKEEIQKRRDELIRELRAKAKIVMDEKALAQFQEKLKTSRKSVPVTPSSRNFLPNAAGGILTPLIMGGANKLPANPGDDHQPPPIPVPPGGDTATPAVPPPAEPKAESK